MTFFFVLVILLGWVLSYVFDSSFILYIAIIYSVFTSFLGYWYSDKIVLAAAGARLIEKSENPELYRIVENLTITAGLPMPKIYILNESQPNAFATGRNPKHSAIAVTSGLLNALDRSELEGVIAHELAHIGDRDTLIQTLVVVLVGIVVFTANLSFRMGGFRRRNKEEGGIGAIILVISVLLIILGPIAANLIKLAISRKREFLADASGALLTRYPEGLASALDKISSDPNPLRTASPSNAHLFISSPFRGKSSTNWFTKLFMTHPPIEERIRILREMEV